MLAWRLYNLNAFTAAQRDEAQGWRPRGLAVRHNWTDQYELQAASRGDTRPPTGLHDRVMRAYTSGTIGIGPVAGLLGRDREELREELAREGLARPSPMMVETCWLG